MSFKVNSGLVQSIANSYQGEEAEIKFPEVTICLNAMHSKVHIICVA